MRGTVHALVTVAALAGAACATSQTSTSGSMPVGTTGTTEPSGPTEVNQSQTGVIPSGQELDVRLESSLSSENAQVEQRFEARTVADLMQNGRVLVPTGSVVRGMVSAVDKAGRVDRTGKLTLAFDSIVVNGREHPFRGTATQVFESGGIREEAGTVGTGAGAGAIVGGILGGLKGAVLGAAIGAGGVIAATEGKDVTLPAGTFVRLRVDQPVDVR